MKKSILILFVLLSQVCLGQTPIFSSSIELEKYKNTPQAVTASLQHFKGQKPLESINIKPLPEDPDAIKKCKERGHVVSGFIGTTLMYCPDYTIDNDSVTIIVHPACNSSWFTCGRCNQSISEGGKETREIIWKKKQLTEYERYSQKTDSIILSLKNRLDSLEADYDKILYKLILNETEKYNGRK